MEGIRAHAKRGEGHQRSARPVLISLDQYQAPLRRWASSHVAYSHHVQTTSVPNHSKDLPSLQAEPLGESDIPVALAQVEIARTQDPRDPILMLWKASKEIDVAAPVADNPSRSRAIKAQQGVMDEVAGALYLK